jgi:hypothetical protein
VTLRIQARKSLASRTVTGPQPHQPVGGQTTHRPSVVVEVCVTSHGPGIGTATRPDAVVIDAVGPQVQSVVYRQVFGIACVNHTSLPG